MLSEQDKQNIWKHDCDSIMENPFALSKYTYKGENIERVTYHEGSCGGKYIISTSTYDWPVDRKYHTVDDIMDMLPDMDVKTVMRINSPNCPQGNQEQPEEYEIGSAVEDLINTIMQN